MCRMSPDNPPPAARPTCSARAGNHSLPSRRMAGTGGPPLPGRAAFTAGAAQAREPAGS
jgi:hypothetical protein